MEAWTDDKTIPFGVHGGKKLANVPPSHLLYIYDLGITYGGLKKYIEDNLNDLENESKEIQRSKQSTSSAGRQ